MSKANPQTIVSDRLLHMEENTKNINHQRDNLYSHLCELLTEVPLQKDHKNRNIDTIKELANISEYVKLNKKRERQPEPQYQRELHENVTRRVEYPEWLMKKNDLLTFEKDSRQKIVQKNQTVQNFQSVHNKLFSNVGVSFGEIEASRIHMAMKKLSTKYQATQIRFWGKILTKNSDYYVIQGVAPRKNPDKIGADMQKYGQGANFYSYWVNDLEMKKEWHELPLITPQQLRTSRLIKYKFTGNLSATIQSYPKFNGREEHFLKAQLVRITHSCEIAPKGLYTPSEENPDNIEFAEEFKLPEFGQLSNLQNWAHLNPHILEQGRSSYWVDPKLTEEQKEQQLAKLGQTDPKQERLKGINEDKPAEKVGFEGSWFVKTVGDGQVLNNVGKDDGTTSCYATVVLRNVNWPGWMTLSNMNIFDSVYIGYGIKATQNAFYPLGPEDLMVEGEDIEEISEPNPRDPPDELEPDSDDENKKADDE